ncbi:MAG: GtrA family protein [Ruminococcus sp.]|uniref:GtrA family protein n=1 Tax=Ruminococcus sp. TaxID=41978 RepID=UPI0025CFC010|nr:GtrA family protein [Ruminococcus sp.]MBO4866400.1 GtrA family protein [Ruminococcus sp.]
MENTQKKDIFDRIMGWGFLKTFEPFYKKNKEVLLYLFFGGLTTIVGLIFFILPYKLLDLQDITIGSKTIDTNAQVANTISWICAVTFAYITNRIWVFENKAHTSQGIAKECLSFYGGRLLTLLIENFLLNLCVENIGMNAIISKVIVSIITIILNYIISKLFVFKKQK